jgi:hypothetical protein
MIVEVDNKKEALGIVPSAFRSQAKIVQLNFFTMQEISDILREHQR